MSDLMNMLLISSDPLITSLRVKKPKRSGSISPDVLGLLENFQINQDDKNVDDE